MKKIGGMAIRVLNNTFKTVYCYSSELIYFLSGVGVVRIITGGQNRSAMLYTQKLSFW